jgi:hypothetical protein
MAKLQLTFASALYDRMQPIYTGEVPVDGIDLNFIRIEQPRPIFDRMSGGEEFDVAEYSSSEFVQRFANRKCPFVAIPVFPSRCFRHSFIAVNRKRGIAKPKDLEGKRIGVALYTMTAAIFIRGLLQHDYGVDFSGATWVQGAINTPGAHGTPDAHLGFKQRYVNPATGASPMPTIGAFAQALPQGFETLPYRCTDGTVYVCLEGGGEAEIDGTTHRFAENDVFVVPSWHTLRLRADKPATLFSFSDRPVQQALGLWREQRL